MKMIPSLLSFFGRGARRRPSPSCRLSLTVLEERDIPSTTLPDVDLSTRGASGWINGAAFVQNTTQPTGSGVMHSFVRVQSNDAIEQGYNTDARPLQFDENK